MKNENNQLEKTLPCESGSCIQYICIFSAIEYNLFQLIFNFEQFEIIKIVLYFVNNIFQSFIFVFISNIQ